MQTLTLSEAFQSYIKNNPSMAESTVEIKRRAFGHFFGLVGDMPIDKIGYAAAEDFRNWLGEHKTKESANIFIANLKPFFNWLIKRGYCSKIPLRRWSFIKSAESARRYFSRRKLKEF